jgi:hypothetical protein
MKSPEARLKRIREEFVSLARRGGAAQKTLLRGMKQQVTLVLKNEFQTSTDPSGTGWKETAQGKPALRSKKLPTAFELELVDGALRGVGKSKRDLLQAHQDGHEFKARQVEANKQFLSFSRKGRLVTARRLFNKAGELRRGAYQIFARAHAVGKRVLPQRQIIPARGGELPSRWGAAVRAGVAIGVSWWVERVSKR